MSEAIPTSTTPQAIVELPCAIADYVPHEYGMCLLDRILHWDDTTLSADVIPQATDVFAERGPAERGPKEVDQEVFVIPAIIGLEWMAQAIAAWSGVEAAMAHQAPRVGFLLGTRRYHCTVPYFACRQRWRIHVQLDYRAANGLGAFTAHIHDEEDREVASCVINVFEPLDSGKSDDTQHSQTPRNTGGNES